MPSTELILTLLLPVLIVLSGLCSGAETALFSLSRSERRAMPGGDANPANRLLARPRRLLVLVLMLNMTVNVLYFIATSLLSTRVSPLWGLVIAVGSLLGIVLFGEVIAKLLARAARVRYATLIGPPLFAIGTLLSPLVTFLDRGLIGPFTRLIVPHDRSPEDLSREELEELVEASARAGVITDPEHHLLDDVLALGERRAKDAMVPRVDMRWVDAGATRDAAGAEYAAFGHARVAVRALDGSLMGLVHLGALADAPPGATAGTLAHKPQYVPETMRLDRLLEEFRNRGVAALFCVDELGDLTGLVLVDDVVRAVMAGSIVHAGPDEMTDEGDGSWSVPGSYALHQLAERFEFDRRRATGGLDRVSTVAGYAAAVLGRLPDAGDRVTLGPLSLTVVELSERRVVRVKVEKLPEPPPPSSSGGSGPSNDDRPSRPAPGPSSDPPSGEVAL